MKFCPDCGQELEFLGLAPGCSGRWRYGCPNPKCDALWETLGCSVSGRISGYQKNWQKYSEWKTRQTGI